MIKADTHPYHKIYSHPAPLGVPPLLLGGFLSRPASAPAGPGTCSPALGMRAAHPSRPTPPVGSEEEAGKVLKPGGSFHHSILVYPVCIDCLRILPFILILCVFQAKVNLCFKLSIFFMSHEFWRHARVLKRCS